MSGRLAFQRCFKISTITPDANNGFEIPKTPGGRHYILMKTFYLHYFIGVAHFPICPPHSSHRDFHGIVGSRNRPRLRQSSKMICGRLNALPWSFGARRNEPTQIQATSVHRNRKDSVNTRIRHSGGWVKPGGAVGPGDREGSTYDREGRLAASGPS